MIKFEEKLSQENITFSTVMELKKFRDWAKKQGALRYFWGHVPVDPNDSGTVWTAEPMDVAPYIKITKEPKPYWVTLEFLPDTTDANFWEQLMSMIPWDKRERITAYLDTLNK